MAFRLIRRTQSPLIDLTDRTDAVSSGTLRLLIRDGYVNLALVNATLAAPGNADLFSGGGDLTGVAPQWWDETSILWASGSGWRATAFTSGGLRVYGDPSRALTLNGTMRWPMTRSMPSTIAGVSI